jgi:aryl-alcohol dehydrogenase-like predicted oxidoreductase
VTDVGRLALGTVQWGLPYGVANRAGQPSATEVAGIAAEAWAAGVTTLDTARAYGDAEAVIGTLPEPWRVVTKLAPDVAGPDVAPEEATERARASLAASRAALGRGRLDAVLLHRDAHRTESGGRAWAVLRDERAAGRIGAIGASVIDPADAASILDDADVEIVQVPASLLDRRLARSGFFAAAAELGREVFVRSVFLQGAAHLPVADLPPHLARLGPPLAALDAVAAEAGIPRATLFLAWARHRLPDARVLVGCETRAQLAANLAAWATPVEPEVVAAAEDRVGELPDAVLDPWRWEAGQNASR